MTDHATWNGEDGRYCVTCDEEWPCPMLLASPVRADKAEKESDEAWRKATTLAKSLKRAKAELALLFDESSRRITAAIDQRDMLVADVRVVLTDEPWDSVEPWACKWCGWSQDEGEHHRLCWWIVTKHHLAAIKEVEGVAPIVDKRLEECIEQRDRLAKAVREAPPIDKYGSLWAEVRAALDAIDD